MRISIVTPVLNGMPWLPETVDSVAAQRGDVDVEHLVRDGGSTDGWELGFVPLVGLSPLLWVSLVVGGYSLLRTERSDNRD